MTPRRYAFGGPAGQYQGTIRTAWESLLLLAHGTEPTRTRARGRVNREKLAEIDLHWHDLRHEAPARAPPLSAGAPDQAGWTDDTSGFTPCS